MTVRRGYDFARTFRKGNERSNAAEEGAGTEKRHSGKRQLENLMKGLRIWKTNLFVPMMWHRN